MFESCGYSKPFSDKKNMNFANYAWPTQEYLRILSNTP